MSERLTELRQLDAAIQAMVSAVKPGGIKPDRSWSIAFNALWEKREQLESAPPKP